VVAGQLRANLQTALGTALARLRFDKGGMHLAR